ncbi:MAG TPA: A24 family peptidase [Acidimicrobiales bacterium]|nr:A24 family peptidase [Acidimicrobiales bacterium]
MTALVGAICAVVGAAAGPYLALVADRIPERKPLRGDGLRTRDTVAVTIAAAVLFGAVGLRFGAVWAVPAFLVFTACLVVVTVTDLRLFLIPNRVVYPTLAATVVLLGGAAAIGHDAHALRRGAIGGLVAWAALLVLHLINPRGMAFGDVRLAAVIGAYTGWLGADHVVLALVLGFVAAALVGLALIATRRRSAKDPVPFGPFLAVGAMAAVLFGHAIIRWYSGG